MGSDENFCVIAENTPEQPKLIDETVRHVCFIDRERSAYFDFIRAIRKNCFTSERVIVPGFADCSKRIFEQTVPKAAREKVEKCLADKNESIALLSKNFLAIRHNLINYSPLIYINGYLYKGNYMDANHLMEAFCNSFEQAPKDCESLEAFQVYRDFSSGGLLRFIIISVVLAAILFLLMNFTFYIVYKRKLSKNYETELQKKISEAMDKYYSPDKSSDYQEIKKAAINE